MAASDGKKYPAAFIPNKNETMESFECFEEISAFFIYFCRCSAAAIICDCDCV